MLPLRKCHSGETDSAAPGLTQKRSATAYSQLMEAAPGNGNFSINLLSPMRGSGFPGGGIKSLLENWQLPS